MKFQDYIPVLSWLPKYKSSDFKFDVGAGLTVGVMLIPQGIAYAMIAGLPPIYGLYTALVPTILYTFFGTSGKLAVGPVALDSIIMASGLAAISVAGSENYIALAVLLAFMVGVVQLLFGLFKLGFVVNFLSKPIISGFTSAAGIIIGLKQLKHLLGIDVPRTEYTHELLAEIGNNISNINVLTIAIGAGGILVLILLKRYLEKVPGPLMVVVIGILLVWLFRMDLSGVLIVGEVPAGLPTPEWPKWNLSMMEELFPLAITLALIGFTEAVSMAKVFNDKNGLQQLKPNQELVALGLGNMVGAIFKSYPSTGGMSRTAVNAEGGAKTSMAGLIAGLVVLVTLLFLTPLFYYLPKAILGSIIMVAVFRLIDLKYPLKLWKYKKDDFAMLMVTFLVTLSVGIKEGVIIGVVLSLIFLIFRSAKPHIAECEQVTGTDYFKNVNRFDNTIKRNHILVFRFDGQLYFANADYFREKLNSMKEQKGEGLKMIVMNAEAINHIDSTAIQMLEDVIQDLKKDGVLFAIAGAIGPVRDIIFSSGLIDSIGKEMMFAEVSNAVDCVESAGEQNLEKMCKKIALQNKGKL